MAVEVYRVLFVNQVAVNVIYSCLGIEMFKTLSVHFIDWWHCRSHSATQPLCQSGWCSHSATQPEWLERPLVSFRFTHLTHRMQASDRLLQHLWPQVLPQVSGCATQCHVVIWRAMTCSILLNWEPCPGPTVAVPLARTNTVGPDDKQHNVEPPDQSSTLVSMFLPPRPRRGFAIVGPARWPCCPGLAIVNERCFSQLPIPFSEARTEAYSLAPSDVLSQDCITRSPSWTTRYALHESAWYPSSLSLSLYVVYIILPQLGLISTTTEMRSIRTIVAVYAFMPVCIYANMQIFPHIYLSRSIIRVYLYIYIYI